MYAEVSCCPGLRKKRFWYSFSMASQFPAGSGSTKKEAQEADAFTFERERLATECKAIKEQYMKEAAIRFKKYEADMRQELLETYFSDKDVFGDKIFEETGLDGVKAGRYAGIESYADPVAYLKKKEASAKSAANTSSGQATNGFTDILKKNLP
ncbi:hypothetical protein POM88_016215 [Heracleum sosnowskyi]|uniref:Uncharacterized protein n=1 Tax=Heracleum sosnowskyi TaxID=360622 RepID=A0AAD8MX52_9APIA|nr:hypothetical protein POM88_016215 [Heracleum sosnowskyi]